MTTTVEQTVRTALDAADSTTLPDLARKLKLGKMCSVIKATFTALTAAAAQDITTAAAAAAATLVGYELGDGETLPPIGKIVTCRVTAGSAAAGNRQITDSGGSASTSVAKLSDDGTTLTFEDTLTGFVLTYIPRADVDMTDLYPGRT